MLVIAKWLGFALVAGALQSAFAIWVSATWGFVSALTGLVGCAPSALSLEVVPMRSSFLPIAVRAADRVLPCGAGRVIVALSGTAPIAPTAVAAPGDMYGQTKRCLEIIAKAIGDAGLLLQSVIRTRMLTDMSRWEEARGRMASSSATCGRRAPSSK
jgi:hypothetical protein